MDLYLFYVYLILAVSALYLLLLHFAGAPRNLPPGPRPLPLIGNLLDLSAHPHRSLARLAERHGPLMALRLGAVTTIVASSADAASDVLQRHDAALSARSVPDAARACAHDAFSMGWLPPGSLRWRALRKVCSAELFAPRRLDAHHALSLRREKATAARVPRRAGGVRGRRRRRRRRLVHHHAEPALVHHLLGRPRGPRRSRGVRGVQGRDHGVHARRRSAQRVGLLPGRRAAGPAAAAEAPREVVQAASRHFRRADRAARAGASRRSAAEERLPGRAARLPLPGGRPGVRSSNAALIAYGVTDLFSAGSDTTAATVEWAMAELLQNPSSLSKARDELARGIGSKAEIEESDIGQLKYLQAIVKETFRLHPPAPLLLPRQAEATTEIGGYTVPKGARVLVNAWAIGRDSNAWFEPEKFMPERFLEKEIDFRGRDFELIPFGSGRRICPGMPLATRMVHLMLASLLHRFEWSLPREAEKDGVDMTEKFEIILGLATPLQAIAKPI